MDIVKNTKNQTIEPHSRNMQPSQLTAKFGQSPRENSKCDFSPEIFEMSLQYNLKKVAKIYQKI
jgi:hypothetical protein